MQKVADMIFTVKFEDGRSVRMTAAQLATLKDKRKYDILDSKGKVIFKKSYRGL